MGRGILAQVAGAAATEVLVYTAPPGETATITAIWMVNRGAATTFRLRATLAQSNTAENRQYLYYDTTLPANDSMVVPLGMALSSGQSLYGQGASANVNFVVFGVSS
jgi:hypothetical protein